MGKQKGEGETTQRMGNKVTDRARLRLRMAPIFHFPISVFVLCSLFLVRWREARTGNTSVSAD